MDAALTVAALSRASSRLVHDHDVIGSVAALLTSTRTAIGVDEGGVLVDGGGGLDVLASSSHLAEHLEMHQAQSMEGPCVEASTTGEHVHAAGDQVGERWPDFGRFMMQAGFHSVHATPLRWHGTVIGAMGLFRREPVAFDQADADGAQAFADMVTLIVTGPETVDLEGVPDRLREVLTARIVIEQAKGALTELSQVTLAEAYDELVRRAESDGARLDLVARQVLEDAGRRR